MNLKLLSEPFKEEEIEFRISQSGKKGNGQVWAMCLAYVQARAIQDRLDEVCGPENWRASYWFEPKGVMCKLEIFCFKGVCGGGEWVSKEDGSEFTEFESFKGGISGAFKRAAVLWGIGRYLYKLESAFADIVDDKHPTKRYAKGYTKDKQEFSFYWVPPRLPAWALPQEEKKNAGVFVHPEQPMSQDGVVSNGYAIPSNIEFYARKILEKMSMEEIVGLTDKIEKKYPDYDKMPPKIKECYDKACSEGAKRETPPKDPGDFDFENSPG